MSALPAAMDEAAEAAARKRQSYWRLVARQYARRRTSVAALILLAVLAVIALAAPFIAGDVPIY